MITKNPFLIVAVVLLTTMCRAQEAQITFKVVDDFGKPVEGATAGIAAFKRWKHGEGFGEDIYESTRVKTDKKGVATIKSKSPRANFAYGISPHPGYYYSGGGDYSFKEAKDNRWQPWNPTVELILKPILNPVPMIAFRVETNIPKPEIEYGFDLMEGDWILPTGKGIVSDLIFKVTGYVHNLKDYDSELTISFTNPSDGIKAFTAAQGAFRSPREAPLDGYQQKLVLRRARKPGQRSPEWVDDTKKSGDYFVRVRTVVGEDGNIKSALYGKIYGNFKFGGAVKDCFLRIEACYLNPETNSRNMEFDPKRNLFKGPSGLGNITAP